MDIKEFFAGMNGVDLCAIQSVDELVNRGMDKEFAEYCFTIFQYLKEHGVPIELIKPNKKSNLPLHETNDTNISSSDEKSCRL